MLEELCHRADLENQNRPPYIPIQLARLPPPPTGIQWWAIPFRPRKWKEPKLHTQNSILCPHDLKASAHSFKQFTSRLLKSTFSPSLYLSLCTYITRMDVILDFICLGPVDLPGARMKNFLSTVRLEPTTLRFKVWCSTDWASRAWWMLSI